MEIRIAEDSSITFQNRSIIFILLTIWDNEIKGARYFDLDVIQLFFG